MSHILVVDDDQAIRDISGKILGRAGYDLALANTAEEGLEKCAATRFDLVVTDLSLPGMSGARFSEVLLERHPKLKILIFSGLLTSAHDGMSQSVLARPGLHFLAKPFRPKELLLAVEAILVG
ncbi:MAG: helix-turn-helix, Fis-type [Magnetococcales bacterium]|nr:helix-turn-helix, Fis-type [Magnetococcales bacterium]HIJ85499.1 response regulator [Magnetococcales bacterium]